MLQVVDTGVVDAKIRDLFLSRDARDVVSPDNLRLRPI